MENIAICKIEFSMARIRLFEHIGDNFPLP